MNQPDPRCEPSDPPQCRNGQVMFVVYAPFGTDDALSTYPDGTTHDIAQHPLIANLVKVAAAGTAVTALVDLTGDSTYFVRIAARDPE